jgi:hypothetical protein
MKKLFAAGLVVALALAGWAQSVRDRARLDVLVAERTKVRDKDQAIAEHLEEYKKEVLRLQEDQARVGEGFDPAADPAKLLPRLETAAKGAHVSYAREGAKITIEGRGGAVGALAALNAVGRTVGLGFVVERVTIGADEWSAALAMEAAGGGTSSPALTPDVPTPLCFAGCAERHGRIAKLDREIAELERLIGDVKIYEAGKGLLMRELDALHGDTRRLPHLLKAANRTFAEPGAIFRTGTLTPANADVVVDGELAKGVDEVELAKRAGGLDIVRVAGGRATLSVRTIE